MRVVRTRAPTRLPPYRERSRERRMKRSKSRSAPASVLSSRQTSRSLRGHDLQLAVLPEVVVVADRAREPVLAGLERDRRLLVAGLAGVQRVGAAVERRLLA